jgi:hypothetical protein
VCVLSDPQSPRGSMFPAGAQLGQRQEDRHHPWKLGTGTERPLGLGSLPSHGKGAKPPRQGCRKFLWEPWRPLRAACLSPVRLVPAPPRPGGTRRCSGGRTCLQSSAHGVPRFPHLHLQAAGQASGLLSPRKSPSLA